VVVVQSQARRTRVRATAGPQRTDFPRLDGLGLESASSIHKHVNHAADSIVTIASSSTAARPADLEFREFVTFTLSKCLFGSIYMDLMELNGFKFQINQTSF
jgi:hypothetical protein